MTENPFSNTAVTPSPETAATDLRSAAADLTKTARIQVSSVKDQAVDAVSNFKAAAVEKAEQFKAVASEKAEQYKAIATEKAEQYRAVATEKVHQARETAQQQWDDTRVRAKEIHVTSEDYIRQNPTKAVLGALGVGFLIGLIARR